MQQPIYVTGQAGTGKTTKLLSLAAEESKRLLLEPYQRMLCMGYMNGARTRLDTSLREHDRCKKITRCVSTIDSFALNLVNRWRSVWGLAYPVAASQAADHSLTERYYRVHTSFGKVVALAVELLKQPRVTRLVSRTYPLTIVDEFQDCQGERLELVKALAETSQLLLAADDFQLLDTVSGQSPAVSWIESLGLIPGQEYFCLEKPHRFKDDAILRAAKALRENAQSPIPTVPVYFAAVPQMLAWRIAERFITGDAKKYWLGTSAIVCPSNDGQLRELQDSCNSQLGARNIKPLHWRRTAGEDEERRALFRSLGIAGDGLFAQLDWESEGDLEAGAAEVRDQVERFAKLKGFRGIPNDLAGQFAERALHARRAYPGRTPRCTLATAHGAKNREFDNVFVFWGYKLPGDPAKERRLLYNAITRAKSHCAVLVIGADEHRVTDDPVLRLLGSCEPAVRPKPPKTERKRKAAQPVPHLATLFE